MPTLETVPQLMAHDVTVGDAPMGGKVYMAGVTPKIGKTAGPLAADQ